MATTLAQNSNLPFVSIRSTCLLTSGSSPAVISGLVDQKPAVGITVGSTAGKVNACISQSFSVTSGTPLTINVSTALDPLGNAAGMVHVSSIVVENNSVIAGQIFTVGGGTHPVLGSDQMTVQPNGGIGCIVNPNPGYAVTGASADTITITVAAGTGVSGKITVMGRTA